MATPPAVEVQVLAAEKGEVQRDADQRPDGARGVAQVPSADAAQETRLPAVAAEGMVAGEVTAADEAMVAAAVSAGAVGPVREMRWKS